MRLGSWVTLGVLLLAGTGVQASGNGFGLFGVDPRTIDYKPIDTGKVVAPYPMQQRQTSFKLMHLLPKFGFNFGKPAVGQSNFPSPAQMLKATGYHDPYRR